MQPKVTVWDRAIRFFHWSQLILVAGLWYTGDQGMMAQHQLLAYGLLALMLSRLIWGFIGSSTARFVNFAATPTAAVRYLRHPYPVTGHNPASFYMVTLLLLLLTIQLITGLATFDNSYLSDGPLVSVLPAYWVDLASAVHKININVLLAAVAVHVVAAIWHSVRIHNVIWVMLSGKQHAVDKNVNLQPSRWFFLMLTIILLLLYWWQGKPLSALL